MSRCATDPTGGRDSGQALEGAFTRKPRSSSRFRLIKIGIGAAVNNLRLLPPRGPTPSMSWARTPPVGRLRQEQRSYDASGPGSAGQVELSRAQRASAHAAIGLAHGVAQDGVVGVERPGADEGARQTVLGVRLGATGPVVAAVGQSGAGSSGPLVQEYIVDLDAAERSAPGVSSSTVIDPRPKTREPSLDTTVPVDTSMQPAGWAATVARQILDPPAGPNNVPAHRP